MSTFKQRVENFLALHLDERRLPAASGTVSVESRPPCHTPHGKQPPERVIDEGERGGNLYRGHRQE
jgi:hypothetical protein